MKSGRSGNQIAASCTLYEPVCVARYALTRGYLSFDRISNGVHGLRNGNGSTDMPAGCAP